uniref:Iron-sulfur cluster assembly SufBD family protein ycf24 n=1 Tax=Compsopogon caeruleus TaxID=31354 RepID=A0A7S1XHR4_9RHOD
MEQGLVEFPSRRTEDWRFTQLRNLYLAELSVDAEKVADLKISAAVDLWRASDAAAVVVVLDGVWDRKRTLVHDPQLSAASVGSWGELSDEIKDQVRGMVNDPRSETVKDPFGKLNSAGLEDIVVLTLPKGVSLSGPVQFLSLWSSRSMETEHLGFCHPRLIVLAEPDSEATVLECHGTVDDVSHVFVNSATDFLVKESSRVRHILVSDFADADYHINTTHASVLQAGSYDWVGLTFGSEVTRVTLGVDLVEDGSSTSLLGLQVADGQRTLDIHSRITHAKPNCNSSQLQKNIAMDRGHSVFRGRVIVDRGAVQTNSDQLCRSLLLSDRAQIDTMPNLEINCDDVKCSHGATVADLEDDEVFYLASRGIDAGTARYLLIGGFATEVLERIPLPNIVNRARDRIQKIASKIRLQSQNPPSTQSVAL